MALADRCLTVLTDAAHRVRDNLNSIGWQWMHGIDGKAETVTPIDE